MNTSHMPEMPYWYPSFTPPTVDAAAEHDRCQRARVEPRAHGAPGDEKFFLARDFALRPKAGPEYSHHISDQNNEVERNHPEHSLGASVGDFQ